MTTRNTGTQPQHDKHLEQDETPLSASRKTYRLFGRTVSQTDVIKLAGLVVFFVAMAGIIWALWPFFGQAFEPGGLDIMVAKIHEAGPWGVGLLLLFQLLQIVVAFIPGEVVQIAAGILYGPVWGTIILLVGCMFASWMIYQVVHRLGKPFVQDMVPIKHLEKFQSFEEKGHLDVMVFILFLIPGMPKDTFTYLVPLTKMSVRRFLIITTIARIPGILVTTLGSTGIVEGNYSFALMMFGISAILSILAIIFREKLMVLGKFIDGEHKK